MTGMRYRRLGRTDLKVSVVGIGTWQFGGEWGQTFDTRQVTRILNRARDLGINLIDTAECYGDHLSESLIGQAIRTDREHWVLATKFGHKFTGHMKRDDLWSADEVRTQLEESLRVLQTDWLDLYQFHSGSDDVFDNEDLWTMLSKQVELGKIRYLGISISSRIDPRHQVAKAVDVGASAIQVVYNRLDRDPEDTVFQACIDQDLGVLARIPLASGFLTGKYPPGAEFAATDDLRSGLERGLVQERLRQVQQIRAAEIPPGVPMAPWALAWCLQNAAVTCAIPGCKSVGQVESNALAATLEIVRTGHPQAWS